MPITLLIALLAINQDLASVGRGNGAILHSREVMRLPLDRHGSPTFMPTGIPAPTVVWLGSSPLVNQMNPAQTFVATGAPAAVGAPFCGAGAFDQVDEMNGQCQTGRRFDGATKLYTAGGSYADINSGSLTACAKVRIDTQSGVHYIVGQRHSSGDTDGWALFFSNANLVITVDGAAGSSAAKATTLGWQVVCGTASVANGMYAYVNGAAGLVGAYPGLPAAWVGNTVIASREGVDLPLYGDLAAVWIWVGTELTASQVKTFSQAAMGVLGSRGEQATFTNTGPVGYWVDGQISVTSDDFPIIGAEIPPGATGAGSNGGYFAHPSVTNKILQSNNLALSWTQSPVGMATCSQAKTPFRDGRTTCRILDDDAGATEYVYQSVSTAGMVAGHKATLCVYAAADSPQPLDVRLTEEAGGTCVPVIADFDSVTATTSWQQFKYTTTIGDPSKCDVLTAALNSTTNLTNAALTGGPVYAISQLFYDIDYCPPIYCDTTTTARTCGADALSYAVGVPVVSGTGTIAGTERISVDWTPIGLPAASGNNTVWQLDDGTSNNRLVGYLASKAPKLYLNPPGADEITAAAQVLTNGTRYVLSWLANFDRDNYQIKLDGVSIGTSTNARNSPAGMNRIMISNGTSTAQPDGGAAVKNVRISR